MAYSSSEYSSGSSSGGSPPSLPWSPPGQVEFDAYLANATWNDNAPNFDFDYLWSLPAETPFIVWDDLEDDNYDLFGYGSRTDVTDSQLEALAQQSRGEWQRASVIEAPGTFLPTPSPALQYPSTQYTPPPMPTSAANTADLPFSIHLSPTLFDNGDWAAGSAPTWTGGDDTTAGPANPIQDGPWPGRGPGTMGDAGQIHNPLSEGVDNYTNRGSGQVDKTNRKRRVDDTDVERITQAGQGPARRSKGAKKKATQQPLAKMKPAHQVLMDEKGRCRLLSDLIPKGGITDPIVATPIAERVTESSGSVSSSAGVPKSSKGERPTKKRRNQKGLSDEFKAYGPNTSFYSPPVDIATSLPQPMISQSGQLGLVMSPYHVITGDPNASKTPGKGAFRDYIVPEPPEVTWARAMTLAQKTAEYNEMLAKGWEKEPEKKKGGKRKR